MSLPRPLAATLRPGHRPPDELAELAADADDARGDVRRALDLAERWGERLPAPGRGSTARLWEALATLGAVDLTVARAVEPHLDALAILGEPAPAAGASGRPRDRGHGCGQTRPRPAAS